MYLEYFLQEVFANVLQTLANVPDQDSRFKIQDSQKNFLNPRG